MKRWTDSQSLVCGLLLSADWLPSDGCIRFIDRPPVGFEPVTAGSNQLPVITELLNGGIDLFLNLRGMGSVDAYIA